MGTSSSSSNDQQKKLYIRHQRFNHCQIIPESQQITSKIKMDFSIFQYQYWEKNLTLLKQDPNSDMLFLPKNITCGTGDNLKLTFDNYPFILQQQIHNRSINNPPQYLEQQQLWMLLYTLVKSQHSFANLSLKVGDIHPHNIFINSEGYPRLACQFSWPNEKSNFQKMYYDKLPRYLSPQEMKLCQQGSHPDICYSNTSQAFSIGLTMLGAGILQSLDRICDLRTFKFNRKYLELCIKKWLSLRYKHPQTQQIVSYSDQLKDIIRGLCHEDINKRYLVSKIYQILKKYESKIVNVQKFKIENYYQLMGLKGQIKQDQLILSNKSIVSPRVAIPSQINSLFIKDHIKNTNNKQQIQYKSIFQHYSTMNSDNKPNKNISFMIQQKNKIDPYYQQEKQFKGNIIKMKQTLKIKQLDQSILQPNNINSNNNKSIMITKQQSAFTKQFTHKNKHLNQQQQQQKEHFTLLNNKVNNDKNYQHYSSSNPMRFNQQKINFTQSTYIPSTLSTNIINNDIILNIQQKIKQSQSMFKDNNKSTQILNNNNNN